MIKIFGLREEPRLEEHHSELQLPHDIGTLDSVFNAIIANKILYALPVYFGYLTQGHNVNARKTKDILIGPKAKIHHHYCRSVVQRLNEYQYLSCWVAGCPCLQRP